MHSLRNPMARSFMRNFVLAAALSLVPFQASFWSTTPAVAQEATLTDPASGDSASKKTRVFKFTYGAVSYTHLTLPTILLV